MPSTTINTTTEDQAAVFHIQGILDHESAVSLETSIENTLSSGKKRIILNCEKLSFISSKGIGALLYMSKIARQKGGALILCSLNEESAALFSLLKLGRYIQTAPDFNQALRTQFIPNRGESGQNMTIEEADDEEILVRSGQSTERIKIFETPIIAECAECATLVRIQKEGDYICPACRTEFQVKANGTVVF